MFPEPEEEKKGEYRSPECSRDRWSSGKSSPEKGWILCGKARKMVRQFSRDWGCPVVGKTHNYYALPYTGVGGGGGVIVT